MKSLLQNIRNLKERLTTSKKEKGKNLFQNKKLIEDIVIVENVKLFESLKHENETLTKVLNKTLDENDR